MHLKKMLDYQANSIRGRELNLPNSRERRYSIKSAVAFNKFTRSYSPTKSPRKSKTKKSTSKQVNTKSVTFAQEISIELKIRESRREITENHSVSTESNKKMKSAIIHSKKGTSTSCLKCNLCFDGTSIFTISAKKGLEETDLRPIDIALKCETLVDQFDALQKSKKRTFAANLLKMVEVKLFWCTGFRIIEQCLTISLPYLMTLFIGELKTYKSTKSNLIYGIILLSVVVSIGSSYFREHSNRLSCRIKSEVGQCLRGIFYSHVITANYSFLKHGDTKFIARMSMYEFDAIVDFIGDIPNLLAFPFTLIMVIFLIVSKLGGMTFSLIIVLVFICILLGIMNKTIIYRQNICKGIGSKRTRILLEMLSDIRSIKVNGWEEYLLTSLEMLRFKEVNTMNKISVIRAIEDALLHMTPVICSIVFIIGQQVIYNVEIDVEVSLAVLSVLTNLKSPLMLLSSYSDMYLNFRIAIKSLSQFFIEISQIPSSSNNYSPNLKLGEIEIFDCTLQVVDMLHIDQILARIASLRSSAIKLSSSPQKKKIGKKRPHEPGSSSRGLEEETERPISRKQTNITQLYQIIGESERPKKMRKVLLDITFSATRGQRIALMGNPNSGCSELLLSIMEEAEVVKGSLSVAGNFSYLDLKSYYFLENKTLRKNIILADSYKESRYRKVLEVAHIDLEQYDSGDMTVVNENGRNLSNGEKRKVILARFLYCERNIYLFDNYFDEIDSNKLKGHFEEVVNEFLKKKTVIYKTRKLEYLEGADKIYIFDKKTIVQTGTYRELESSPKRYFKELLIVNHLSPKRITLTSMKSFHKELLMKKISMKADNLHEVTKAGALDFMNKSDGTVKNINNKELVHRLIDHICSLNLEKKMTIKEAVEPIFERPLDKIILDYLGQMGFKQITIIIILFISVGAFLLGSEVWLGLWSSDTFPSLDFWGQLCIYIGITFIAGTLIVIRGLIYNSLIRSNSNMLYSTMINKCFITSMRWFIENPSSTLTYRLTRDQRIVDERLNYSLERMLDSLMIIIAGIVILNFVFVGAMLLVTVVVALYIRWLLRRYLQVVRFLTIQMNNSKAQLQASFFNSMGESIHYRGLCCLDDIQDKFFTYSDKFQMYSTYINMISERWLRVRLGGLQAILILITFCLPLILPEYLPNYYHRTGWKFALAISWNLKLLNQLTSFILFYSKAVQDTISLGRIIEFLEHRYEEDQLITGKGYSLTPSDVNTTRYSFCFNGVTLKYDKNTVLSKATFKIPNRGRVAIIGQVSSGKHSIMNALLKIYDINAGSIELFGKDVSKLRAKQVRGQVRYLSERPGMHNGKVIHNINHDTSLSLEEVVKLLAFLGFFDLIKLNTASLEELKEWEEVNHDPESKLRMILNLVDHMSVQRRKRSVEIFQKNVSENSKHSIFSKLYEGLYSDMLLKGKQDAIEDSLNNSNRRDKMRQTFRGLSKFYSNSNRKISSNILSEERYRKLSSKGDLQKYSLRFKKLAELSKMLELNNIQIGEFKEDSEYKTIVNFLRMKVLGGGSNIPTNLRKLVLLAREIIYQPAILFFEERSIDFGLSESWTNNIRKVKSCFPDTTIVGLLKDYTKAIYFDQIIIVENGKIVESGRFDEIITDENSILSRGMKATDPVFYLEYMEALKMCQKDKIEINKSNFHHKTSSNYKMKLISMPESEEEIHSPTVPLKQAPSISDIADCPEFSSSRSNSSDSKPPLGRGNEEVEAGITLIDHCISDRLLSPKFLN